MVPQSASASQNDYHGCPTKEHGTLAFMALSWLPVSFHVGFACYQDPLAIHSGNADVRQIARSHDRSFMGERN
jgi:hypothetical protein